MRFLRELLDRHAHHFERGGRLEKLFPLYEATDTFLYTPATVTRARAHVRDALDLKRMMILVVVALIPCTLMAMYNTGLQALTALDGAKVAALEGWRYDVLRGLGVPYFHLGRLGLDQGQEFSLADEKSVRGLFPDCDPGVIPGLPQAWGVEMIWDDALMAQPDIYLEAGDHERLVHVETKYLWDLFGDAPHCHFSQTRLPH